MNDEPEFLTTLRSAHAYLMVKGQTAEARAVEDCIATFIAAWSCGQVTRTVGGRYMWGVAFPPSSPGV